MPTLMVPLLKMVPLLAKDVLPVVKVVPAPMLMVPALAVKPVPVVMLPAVAFSEPLLVKVVGVMFHEPPELAAMVALLTMGAVLLSLRVPVPCSVRPVPMVKVWPFTAEPAMIEPPVLLMVAEVAPAASARLCAPVV